MTAGGYLAGTNHGATLSTAMSAFHEALTRRWRELVCEQVAQGSHDYPTAICRPASPHHHQPLWPYWSLPARHHLAYPADCAVVRWVRAGQDGPLSAVHCDGATGVREDDVQVPDLRTGELVHIPRHIDCGMASIMQQVEEWAWGEREQIFHQLPLFDHHDVGALAQLHHTLLRLGHDLGLAPDPASSSEEVKAEFPVATAEGDIPSRVERIGTEMDGEDGSDRGQNRQRDWWTAWTGLKASRFKTGFFSHVRPTLTNQAGIAGALANLCCDRAAIIEQGRNNALYWIEWATKSLGQGEVQVTDLTEGWKTLHGVGSTIGLTAPWVPGAAKLGAAMTVIGFLGEKLFPHVSQEGYKHSVPEVVTEIKSRIRELNEYLDGNERAYELAASRLRSIVASIPRDDLELYDLTRNDPAGEPDRGSGFEVDVATVFQLSADCYRVAAQYEQILPKIASTAHCDKYLSDKDGIPTSGDRDFLIVRDVLQQSLKVTCDRYSVAGDQIRIAAHEYQRVEGVNQDYFDRHMRDFEGAVDYQ